MHVPCEVGPFRASQDACPVLPARPLGSRLLSEGPVRPSRHLGDLTQVLGE